MSGGTYYTALFILAIIYRYFRLIVSCFAFLTYRSNDPGDEEKRRYSSHDVTVVIPSLFDGDSEQIHETIKTVLVNSPALVILVTIDKNFERALGLARRFDEKRVLVLSNAHANKRLQMLNGMRSVTTSLTVLCDDDVYWKPRTLAWMVAPFDDQSVGATGTCQRLRRAVNPTISQRLWNFLAAAYLERRNFDCASCNAIDGGLPCLSGRTAMYRTEILNGPDFQDGFRHEMWRGSKLNHADDDNFLTRWLVTHGYKIKMQYSDECEIETTLADDSKFRLQCLRWSRSNWRSNITSLFNEKHVWRSQPWSTYSVFLTTITAWSVPWDIGLIYLLYQTTASTTPEVRLLSLVVYSIFWLFARSVKLFGHFRRYPADVFFLPLSILFGYIHCLFIKTWALYTLNQTTWGSRTNADVDDDRRMQSPPPYSFGSGASTKDSQIELDEPPTPRPHRLSVEAPLTA